MAEETNNPVAQEGVELSGVDKLQNLYEDNAMPINIGIIAILLVICGIIFYTNIWKPKQELAAQEAMYQAQFYFEQDSFALALNGTDFDGFLTVIDNHGGTKAGNLAHYYAGVCYYNVGDFTNAIVQMQDFDTSDEVLGALAYNVMADAQMELGQANEALANYSKAADFSDNEASGSVLKLKAGMAYENQGNTEEAKKYYTEVIENYPNTTQATDAEKLLNKIQ